MNPRLVLLSLLSLAGCSSATPLSPAMSAMTAPPSTVGAPFTVPADASSDASVPAVSVEPEAAAEASSSDDAAGSDDGSGDATAPTPGSYCCSVPPIHAPLADALAARDLDCAWNSASSSCLLWIPVSSASPAPKATLSPARLGIAFQLAWKTVPFGVQMASLPAQSAPARLCLAADEAGAPTVSWCAKTPSSGSCAPGEVAATDDYDHIVVCCSSLATSMDPTTGDSCASIDQLALTPTH
jgi:hypothetical protein